MIRRTCANESSRSSLLSIPGCDFDSAEEKGTCNGITSLTGACEGHEASWVCDVENLWYALQYFRRETLQCRQHLASMEVFKKALVVRDEVGKLARLASLRCRRRKYCGLI